MTRAVMALVGDETMGWVAADNSRVEVTQTTLKKAVRLAGKEMERLWVK